MELYERARVPVPYGYPLFTARPLHNPPGIPRDLSGEYRRVNPVLQDPPRRDEQHQDAGLTRQHRTIADMGGISWPNPTSSQPGIRGTHLTLISRLLKSSSKHLRGAQPTQSQPDWLPVADCFCTGITACSPSILPRRAYRGRDHEPAQAGLLPLR